MEYDYAQSVERPFNLAAVMLTDAVVSAAGGSGSNWVTKIKCYPMNIFKSSYT